MMKRPFACVGFTCLLTLMAAVFILKENCLWLGIAVLVLFGISMLFAPLKKAGVVPTALAVCALSLLYFGYSFPIWEQASTVPEGEYKITARISDFPEKDGEKFVYQLEVLEAKDESENPVSIRGKVRMTSRTALTADALDVISGTIFLYHMDETMAPYYAARGIFHNAYWYEYDSFSITRSSDNLWNEPFRKLREKMEDVLYTLLPEPQAGLISGMVLGDKGMIPEDISEDFRMAGVSHLLSVSGLHLSVLVQGFLALLLLLGLPRKVSLFLSMPVVLSFMTLAGFSYSIMRSGIMFLLYLAAELLNRKSDGLNSLGIAVFLLCAINPFSAGDIGFLLSCSSTLGIILFQNGIAAWCKMRLPLWLMTSRCSKLADSIVDSFSVTISSTVFTLPISILSFGTLSTIGILSNLLMVLPGTFLLITGALTVITGIFSINGALPFGAAAGILANYELAVSHWLSGFPFATVRVSYEFVYLLLAGLLTLLGICLLCRQRKILLFRAAWMFAVAAVITMTVHIAINWQVVSVSAFYSGGEIHVVAASRGNGVVLLGETPSRYLLVQKGIRYLLDTGEETGKESSEVFGDDRMTLLGKTDTAAYFECYGVSFLLCAEKCDAEDLPESWRSPDMVWLTEIPKHYELINAKLEIALTEEAALKNEGYRARKYGRFQVDCYPNQEIRAGKDW